MWESLSVPWLSCIIAREAPRIFEHLATAGLSLINAMRSCKGRKCYLLHGHG